MKKISTLMVLFAGFAGNITAQQVRFPYDFAPSEMVAKSVERPFRNGICLNGSWKFCPVKSMEQLNKEQVIHPKLPTSFSWESVPLKVPSPWNVNSFAAGGGDFITFPSYPQEWNTVKAGWLMRKFSCKKEWVGKKLILHFDAVAGYTQVFVNKKMVVENYDIFLPFEVDITDKVNREGDNELLIWVADANLLNQPGKYGRRLYVGGSFWGQHIIGIWQDVALLVKPAVYEKNTFVKTLVDKGLLQVESTIINASGAKKEITITGNISPWISLAEKNTIGAPVPKWKLGRQVIAFPLKKITLAAGEEKTLLFTVNVRERLKLWTSEMPNLYGLLMTLSDSQGVIDQHYNRFGWREFKIVGNKFYLNGQQVTLKGDSWHFMGIPQMTRRYAWAWFTMLKDAHANAIRLHAEPYPSFYLDMADEMGMFILDETGMWASDAGPKEDSEAYWTNAATHLKRFIMRDRNHPSIFGWSVCNENIPVAVYVLHSPDSLVQKQLGEINRWVAITREMDPTRNWISGDGETGKSTDLPTIIGHYGDENAYREWSSTGKLWGIGESGMAYYGTPRQTSVYNGNRSYESQEERMKGVAAEAVHLFNLQKKYNASYLSVFNLVWYGLKPLELGMKDTMVATKSTDGIFFNSYREGMPGVQPERLGPYTSTLNPGYDASLPLYRTWPLFDAAKASFINNDSVKENFQFEVKEKDTVNYHTSYSRIVLLSADPDNKLAGLLQDMGAIISDSRQADNTTLVILDGMYPPADDTSISFARSIPTKGGKIFICGVQPGSVAVLNRYLPDSVIVMPRKSSSFIIGKKDQILNGLSNADFYFSETSSQPLANYCLSGDFVKRSKVLLQPCNTEWRAWNNQPEYSKTISVLKSERETKPEGAAIVVSEMSKICFAALDCFMLHKTSEKVLSHLLFNLGAIAKEQSSENLSALNANGVLQNALLLDSADSNKKAKTKIISATHGFFNFKSSNSIKVPVYISFWLFSPRSLVNLLAEPDMPVLNMNVSTNDSFRVYLNEKFVDVSPDKSLVKSLSLEKGWNHILIKKMNDKDDVLAVRFNCTNKEYLNMLRSHLSN